MNSKRKQSNFSLAKLLWSISVLAVCLTLLRLSVIHPTFLGPVVMVAYWYWVLATLDVSTVRSPSVSLLVFFALQLLYPFLVLCLIALVFWLRQRMLGSAI